MKMENTFHGVDVLDEAVDLAELSSIIGGEDSDANDNCNQC
ncbi:hypothetical protein [Paenibacillus elgii]|nr:hypothetical protein [Paenibacillus elgii]